MQGRKILLWSALPPLIVLLGVSCKPDADQLILVEDLSEDSPGPDADQDGYTILEGDCDDNNPYLHPGASEGTVNTEGRVVGDGIDNNCDGRIDDNTISYDDDNDGYTEVDGDCDDQSGSRNPGVLDGCDAIDNDCDGELDEDAVDAYDAVASNNDFATATDMGDLSCNYANVEFNLHVSSDVDVFRFSVDGEGIECAFGVTAYIVSSPARPYALELYKQVGGSIEFVDASEDVTEDVIIGTEDQGDSAKGTYYVVVNAGSGTGDPSPITCSDTSRVYMYGIYGYELDEF